MLNYKTLVLTEKERKFLLLLLKEVKDPGHPFRENLTRSQDLDDLHFHCLEEKIRQVTLG